MSTLIDSHCHLDQLSQQTGEPLEAYLNSAREAGISRFLNVSIRSDTIATILDIAQQHSDIFASAGIHPNEHESSEPTVEQLIEWAKPTKVIAVGETGLDYFHGNNPDKTLQQQRFRRHIQAAREIKKPLIIHCREAANDTINILRQEGAEQTGGIMHCFVEDLATAEAAMALGFYISLSGIVTFKNAKPLQQVVAQLPLERLLVETDSPYLAPTPWRGKPNQPRYVTAVAEKVAELQQRSFESIAEATTTNFNTLFALPAAASA
ncbi:TatD family deoxyribonuclease [Ectothiorhodospiraceae bacterium BW-2]|nr:TatD family deoxyribonuclease [Ectothiorhodospiraceae bacterium BW-2]